MGLNLAEHLRPGLYRVGGVGCRDARRTPERFRRRVLCPGPAVRLAFFVEFLPEIPDNQIAAHLQIGHGALEVLLSTLAESGPLFELIGKQCVCIGELVHDLLLAGGGETIVPPAVKVVAVPPPVGKIREPGFGDEARLLAEEFAVGHPAAAGNQLPPLPGITGGIPAPPVVGQVRSSAEKPSMPLRNKGRNPTSSIQSTSSCQLWMHAGSSQAGPRMIHSPFSTAILPHPFLSLVRTV